MADISIIIPAYNAGKYIEKCISSILNQTKKELEIIIINDGSTDNTEEVIKSFKDDRIIYFKNKNQGIGKTRNFGIDKATGKYMMFIDSDDYLAPEACEEMYNRMEKDDLDMVLCDFFNVYDDGRIEEYRTPSFENASVKENPSIITEDVRPWAKCYKTSFIKEKHIRFVEDLKYEDSPFSIETLSQAKKIGKIDKCLNYYVIHGNSQTTVRDRRCFDIFKVLERERNFTKDMPYLKEQIDKFTVRILTNYTIQQRAQEHKEIIEEFINKAFEFLEKEVPDYKDNKYYEGRGFLRRTIEKNKFLTKLYIKIYRITHH